jgi:hypothetical protein
MLNPLPAWGSSLGQRTQMNAVPSCPVENEFVQVVIKAPELTESEQVAKQSLLSYRKTFSRDVTQNSG